VIVVDSSFLVAYHNTRDAHHGAAGEVMERLLAGEWGEALLPEYVFLEVTTVLAARQSLESVVAVGRTLLAARELRFVPCSDLFLDAFENFQTQSRADLGFADAAIVAIARKHQVEHIATFDADFRNVPGVTVVP
jgi:predicted nucleic acid-binding protein